MNIDSAKIPSIILEFAPKLVLAIIILIVGNLIIKWVSKLTRSYLGKSGIDPSLSKFLGSLVQSGLKLILILSIVSMLGVPVTSFAAILGGLMVGIGMALNGTIGHFAAGVLLMIFKPFKVDDLIEIGGGRTGTVVAINAFNTTLATLDNKRIIVGNSNVINNDIVNISGQGVVGVELSYGIGYNDSIDKAREIILQVGKSCPEIIDSPQQGVVVGNLADSAVMLNTRPFCKSEHYWDVYFYMQENVKKHFDAAGIGIPFPQMDIHIQQQN